MQEIKKRSIVLASVLKPATDTRMYSKMALSLINSGQWQVHVIGSGTETPQGSNIEFHALGTFDRISFKRLIQPWRVLLLLFKIRPDQVIVTTHELLITGVLYKLLTGSKLYYDLQENYKLNILNTNTLSLLLKWFASHIIRGYEWGTSPFINHFFLAEKIYAQELPFIGRKYSILENKAILPASFKHNADATKLNLLFSGTLDTSTGVFEAIELTRKLYSQNQNVSLTIIGFAALKKVRNEIHAQAKRHPFIRIVGIDQPVFHNQILEAIGSANAGIIFYPPSAHTAQRVPTKLYEYMAAQLPILYDIHASWCALPDQWQAGIAVDFNAPDAEAILSKLTKGHFYPNPPKGIFWAEEAHGFLQALR